MRTYGFMKCLIFDVISHNKSKCMYKLYFRLWMLFYNCFNTVVQNKVGRHPYFSHTLYSIQPREIQSHRVCSCCFCQLFSGCVIWLVVAQLPTYTQAMANTSCGTSSTPATPVTVTSTMGLTGKPLAFVQSKCGFDFKLSEWSVTYVNI